MMRADWSPAETEIRGPRRPEAKADNLERVLLVDDDPDLLSGLEHLLSERYEVLTASNGAEALHVLELETVDVVVLDMLMPFVDGQGVLRELLGKTNPPAVVVVSARPDLIARSIEMGADDFLAKPFGIAQLERKIDNLIERGDRGVSSRG
jgi:two-component system response regulator MprA